MRRAMTLTETVTSVATLAVVASLLLPAAGEARRQSKEVHCMSNLSRIMDASAIYAATDPNELATPVHSRIGSAFDALGQYEWGGKSGVGAPQFGTDPTDSLWGTKRERGPATRMLNPVIYGDHFADHWLNPGSGSVNWLADTNLELDVYRCPSDYGSSGGHWDTFRDSGLTSYDHYGNSYVASTMWVGFGPPGGSLSSNTPFLRALSRVPTPGRTLMYLENAGRFAPRRQLVSTCSSTPPLGVNMIEPIRGWHGRNFLFNAAYVDGHVARTFIDGHLPPPDISRYPLSGDYQNWRCVIYRGKGWQVDTLPDPPIPTSLSFSANGSDPATAEATCETMSVVTAQPFTEARAR